MDTNIYSEIKKIIPEEAVQFRLECGKRQVTSSIRLGLGMSKLEVGR